MNIDKIRGIDSIYTQLDIEDTLENLGIQISQHSGDELICHCPHTENHANGDRNPSFSFNKEKGVGFCFVCGSSTILDLVKYMLEIDDAKAEDWLREQTIPGMGRTDLKEKVMERLNRPSQREILPEYDASILEQYRYIHPYLYDRRISKEVIIEMKIGYDEFHDAIVIPHFYLGKLRGFQRRHLSACSICESPVPKYKSTKDLPKKTTLYNFDHITSDSEVIMVESPMSVLRLKSIGINNVVATFGSWSPRQIDLLMGVDSLILWPDNDPSGEASIARVINQAIRIVPVKIAPVHPDKRGDPGDLTESEIKDYLRNTYSPLIFKQKGLLNVQEIRNARES